MDYKDPAWLAANRARLNAKGQGGASLPVTPENSTQGKSGVSGVVSLLADYREALAPVSRSGDAALSRTPARGSSNGNSLTVTPSHSGTNCLDFGL